MISEAISPLRLWRNDGLCMRLLPFHRNHVRSFDFVQAPTQDGRSLRILTLIDGRSRACLALKVGRCIDSVGVIEALADAMCLTSRDHTGRRVRTTVPDPAAVGPPDRVDRQNSTSNAAMAPFFVVACLHRIQQHAVFLCIEKYRTSRLLSEQKPSADSVGRKS